MSEQNKPILAFSEPPTFLAFAVFFGDVVTVTAAGGRYVLNNSINK
jgi:hypothetical protein